MRKVEVVKSESVYPCGAKRHCGYGRCLDCGWESEDLAVDFLTLEVKETECPICGGRVVPYCGHCESDL